VTGRKFLTVGGKQERKNNGLCKIKGHFGWNAEQRTCPEKGEEMLFDESHLNEGEGSTTTPKPPRKVIHDMNVYKTQGLRERAKRGYLNEREDRERRAYRGLKNAMSRDEKRGTKPKPPMGNA